MHSFLHSLIGQVADWAIVCLGLRRVRASAQEVSEQLQDSQSARHTLLELEEARAPSVGKSTYPFSIHTFTCAQLDWLSAPIFYTKRVGTTPPLCLFVRGGGGGGGNCPFPYHVFQQPISFMVGRRTHTYEYALLFTVVL